jgi:uncharacterized protein YegP (UPF0339 family)
MAGKFVVKKGTTGKFRFDFLSTNGKVIAKTEAYETKRACMAAIESVRKNAPSATIADQTASSRATSRQTTKK